MNLYAYVGGNPVNAVDPWGLAAINVYDGGFDTIPINIPGIGKPSGPAIVGGGIGLGLAFAIDKAIDSAQDGASDEQCKDPCKEILEKIAKAMKMLNRYYLNQCRDKKGQWNAHVGAYDQRKAALKNLIDKAERLGCKVPQKAYDWLNMACPRPGTPYDTSPGY